MASNLVRHKYFFVIFAFCIGQGDGRWKRKEKGGLYHDVEVFKNMAEKIEHEIEAFYEDYPDEQIKYDGIEKIQQEYIKNIVDRKKGTKNLPDRKETRHKFAFTANITTEIPGNLRSGNAIQSQLSYVSLQNSDPSISKPNWPKFEDILLEMGKKYDWKNDRWIKVKRKLKWLPKKIINDNKTISFHEKHKFSYRTVKLNRKSRRNIVIAVTAVR